MFFKVLSAAIMVVSVTWGLALRDGSRWEWPVLTYAIGLGMGIAAF